MLRPLPGPQLSLLSSVPTDWSLVKQIQFDTPVSQYLQDHVMLHSGGEVKVGRVKSENPSKDTLAEGNSTQHWAYSNGLHSLHAA